ncbi:MAG: hypothetical protein EZS28_034620 [Streblomastix strix]|uniref:Uncharacterized protein n=1 Tax=Streblomastix strix TaxID=222440 RepID=A0A5J4UIY8_9EUKA|nr:MAG: hypothetical protein EZS28_034620 [Streblomastix strix]
MLRVYGSRINISQEQGKKDRQINEKQLDNTEEEEEQAEKQHYIKIKITELMQPLKTQLNKTWLHNLKLDRAQLFQARWKKMKIKSLPLMEYRRSLKQGRQSEQWLQKEAQTPPMNPVRAQLLKPKQNKKLQQFQNQNTDEKRIRKVIKRQIKSQKPELRKKGRSESMIQQGKRARGRSTLKAFPEKETWSALFSFAPQGRENRIGELKFKIKFNGMGEKMKEYICMEDF